MGKKNKRQNKTGGNFNQPKQKIFDVPSNEEVEKIMSNDLLCEEVKKDLITLHRVNRGLKSTVNDIIKLFISDGKYQHMVKEYNAKFLITNIDIYTPHTEDRTVEHVTEKTKELVGGLIDGEIPELCQSTITIITANASYPDRDNDIVTFVYVTGVESDADGNVKTRVWQVFMD